MYADDELTLPPDIVIVYGSLRTGGIETLIVRIANHLVSSGAHVKVCCKTGGILETSLDPRVKIVTYTGTKNLVRSFKSKNNRFRNSETVLIISFDPISAARALMLESTLRKIDRIIHISGVFHPRAYFMSGERKDRITLNHLVAMAVGKHRLFFMNEECRKAHSIKWGNDLSLCPLVPLPLNFLAQTWKPSTRATVQIVSIGRLVDFKAYNIGASKIVRACRDRGFDVSWDIYGDGPLYNTIKAEIVAFGVDGYVRLMGCLDYSEFSSTVGEYDLFVGMGTAALEAAMVGVPTICATVDEDLHCYGYLYELPYGNVGELQSTRPRVVIAQLIQEYAVSDIENRAQISGDCRKVAEKYGMPHFVRSIARIASRSRQPPSKILKNGIAHLYCFVTESCLAKIARRFGSVSARVS